MPNVQAVKKDFVDILVHYFTNAKPREFFKTLNNLTFWNKHFTGIDNGATKASLGIFPKVFDAFNLLDFMDNINNVRNHLNGKVVSKDVASLISDTTNSAAETTAWFSTVGILSFSSYTMSWVTSMSGATLMFSFGKKIIQNISDLRKPENKDINRAKFEKKNIFWNLVTNISLFAIGVILFTCGWFGYAMFTTLLTLASTAALISEFKIYYLNNVKKEEEKTPNFLQKIKNKFMMAPASA